MTAGGAASSTVLPPSPSPSPPPPPSPSPASDLSGPPLAGGTHPDLDAREQGVMRPRELLGNKSAQEREELARDFERELMEFEDRWVQELRYSYTRGRIGVIPGARLRIFKGQGKGQGSYDDALPEAESAVRELETSIESEAPESESESERGLGRGAIQGESDSTAPG